MPDSVNALPGVNLFIVDDQHLTVLDVQNLDVLYTLALGITLLRDEGHLAAAIAEILCAGAIAGAHAVRTAAPFVHRQQPAIVITRDAVVGLVLGGGSGQVFGKHGALPGGCIPHGGGAVLVVAFGNAAAERPVVAGQGVIEVAVADDTAVCVGVAVIIVDFLRRGDDGAIIDLVPLGGGALVGGKVITPDLHGGIIIFTYGSGFVSESVKYSWQPLAPTRLTKVTCLVLPRPFSRPSSW